MENLRRYIAELRKNLTPEEVTARSNLAVVNLAKWLVKNAPKLGLIGIYRPMDSDGFGEMSPTALLRIPALSKAHFAFPRVVDRFNCEMDFAVPMHATDWVKGAYGNPEPRTDLPAVDPFEFDAIVVPGVVFGAKGERIGRGAGYYDRYLATAGSALRVGFGFDFQLLTEPVPQAEWDARMDAVVTDLRTLETSSRPAI